MAIDPRIALQGQVASIAPAINIFENALMNAQTRDIRAQQAQRAQELVPFQLQQAQQGVDINQQTLNQNRDTQRLTNLHQTGQRLKPFLESNDIQGAQQFLLDNIAQIQTRIEQGSGEDVTESMETLAKLQTGDTQGVLGDIEAVSSLVNQSSATAGQREFTSLTTGLSEEDKTKAARIKLRLDAGASLTGQERIALNNELGEKVVKQLEAEAGAKEGGKLKQQRKHLPTLRKEIKLAETAAAERGEVLTDLSRMNAGLPGLLDAVAQLKELSALATSNFLGGVFDAAVKQTGFGSTKGSTAKAKMVAIIANQTLPLLKETFGSAFTEAEGARLEASFANPDSTHEERLAQLDAFIDQKTRTIKAKETQLGVVPTESANNADVPDVDISTLSIEELIAERNRLGGQ